MKSLRVLGVVAAVLIAVVLQVSLFARFGWHGIAPNLVLLVVVAAALTRGAGFAMALGFAGGLALDLAPPAAHLAGRWALALVLVGYFVSRVRPDSRSTIGSLAGTVAAGSFIGTSVFALLGFVVGDAGVAIPEMLVVIGVSVITDVVLALVALPPLMRLFRRLGPVQALTG